MIRSVFKVAIRKLINNPLHSIVNVAGLSIGLATVILIGIWVNFHQNFDSKHDQKDYIYRVMTNSRDTNGEVQTTDGVVYQVMEDAKEKLTGIEKITRIVSNWRWPSELCFKSDSALSCVYQKGIYADSLFFEVFDFEIVKGNTNPLSEPRNIAISESMAKALFGDQEALNSIYKLDNHYEVKIAAIFKDTPPNSSLQFDFIAPLEVLLGLWGQTYENVKGYSFITYLTTEGSIKNLEEGLNNLTINNKYDQNEYFLQPLGDQHLYSSFDQGQVSGGLITYLRIFILFAVFIFVISSVNFINMATAIAALRAKEIGVRKVTGATRLAIMTQFVAEAFLKVTLAMFLALLLVYYFIPLLNQITGDPLILTFNSQMIFFLSVIVVVCTSLTGIYPAIVMSRFNPVKALKNSQHNYLGKQPMRKWLTFVQISISVVIILVTVVVYQQINYLQNKDIGYDRSGIMILEPTFAHIKQYDAFKQQLLSNPLVKSAGVSNSNMVNSSFASNALRWSGKSEGDNILFKVIGGDQSLLETFELELIEGNGFNAQSNLGQVILTESAIELMELNDPIGSKVIYYNQEAEIVGIVPDFNSESLHESRLPVVLYHIKPQNASTIYIRYDKENTKAAIEHITQKYNEFEKYFSIKYSLLDEEYEALYKNEIIMSKLSMTTMIISITIAIIGLLGLSSYNLIRRYKEIGVRKVFGASSSQIIKMLSKDFVVITLLANMIAWPVAIYLSKEWLDGFAYRIEIPFGTFAICLAVILGLVLLVIGMQSYGASLTNPVKILKEE